MEVVSERPSTSPEDKMFANIVAAWNKIMDADNDDAVYRVFDWAAHTSTGQEVAARDLALECKLWPCSPCMTEIVALEVQ